MAVDSLNGMTDPAVFSQKSSSLKSSAEVFDRDDVQKERLMEACKDFESIFVKMMLDSMKKTVEKSDLLPENQSQKVFEDMLYKSYSEKITETNSFGLAQKIFDQYSPLLNARSPEEIKNSLK
ncbi:MAG: rod-binding protein [Spirochaetales bacterium]|nr:rod-binding protein [Spirochaetales bacterium]